MIEVSIYFKARRFVNFEHLECPLMAAKKQKINMSALKR